MSQALIVKTLKTLKTREQSGHDYLPEVRLLKENGGGMCVHATVEVR